MFPRTYATHISAADAESMRSQLGVGKEVRILQDLGRDLLNLLEPSRRKVRNLTNVSKAAASSLRLERIMDHLSEGR